MLSFLLIVLGLIFISCRYSRLPIGRALHGALIEGPASWLAKTSPLRVAIILVLVVGVTLALAELSPLLMASDYALMPWLVDMSVYLDAVVMVWATVAAIRIKAAGHVVSDLLQRAMCSGSIRQFARPRPQRSRRQKGPPPPKEDAPSLIFRVVGSGLKGLSYTVAGPLELAFKAG